MHKNLDSNREQEAEESGRQNKEKRKKNGQTTFNSGLVSFIAHQRRENRVSRGDLVIPSRDPTANKCEGTNDDDFAQFHPMINTVNLYIKIVMTTGKC